MPIYAYRCETCGHAKDVLQKLSDPLLSTCPACGAETFRKQVTAAGFQLKGSGWYVTDFRGGDGAKGKPAAEGDAAPAAKPADGATPAAATPAAAPAPAAGGSDAAKPAAAPPPSTPSSTGS
jgi:putative FmdB family regulatory protein